MRAQVRLLGGTATVNDGEWTASRPGILRIVSGITPALLLTQYTPDFDLALAEEAARLFGGEVIEYDGPPETTRMREY